MFCAGIALRVPTPNVSIVDLVLQVEKKTFAEEARSILQLCCACQQSGIVRC